ncbi:hypothetical protein ACSSS7_000633 [Eimeria intestinalis]
MPEGDIAIRGLVASPFYPVDPDPDPDPTFSSPLTVEDGSPPEVLKAFPVGGPPPPKPPAASRIYIALVSSIGLAVALLLAFCFRRRRSRGPTVGPQVRSLAGQQHLRGPPEEEEDDEADDFLANTLEGCLDMEREFGLGSDRPPQPLPPTPYEAISSIVFSLQDAALLYEVQQISGGLLAGIPPVPSPEEGPSTVIDLTNDDEDQWSGQGTGVEPEGGAHSGAPQAPIPMPATPIDARLQAASAAPTLVSLLQQQRPQWSSSSKAAAATAAGEEEVELSPVSSSEEGSPSTIDLTSDDEDQWSGQGTGFGPERGAHSGAPQAPIPMPAIPIDAGLQGASAAPTLVSAQQQEQQRSSSSKAAAATAAEEEEVEPPPAKKAKGDTGKASGQPSLYGLLQHRPKLTEEQQQQQRDLLAGLLPAVAPPRRTRARILPSQIGSLTAFPPRISSSSGGAATGELSPAIPQAAGPSGSPQASASEESRESTRETWFSLLGPRRAVAGQGYLTLTLDTGEVIFFAHPAPPNDATTPLHYRLPFVPPDAVQTHFRTQAALKTFCCARIWEPLDVVRSTLQKPVLDAIEVTQLMAAAQQLFTYLVTRQSGSLAAMAASKAVERFAMRYLCLEALVNCIFVLGPAMKPEEWFFFLIARLPIEFKYCERAANKTAVSRFNLRLVMLIREAITELKAGRRPSLQLTEKIKRKLFVKNSGLLTFRQPQWDRWRDDLEDPDSSDDE